MEAKRNCYKGTFFRSNTEIRWAQFFEFAGVRFEYEPEIKSTSLGGYIPDFYFRSLNTYVEIKGGKITEDEITKLKDVCEQEKATGFIISSFPKVYPYSSEPHLANCCIVIIRKGKVIPTSADSLYQCLRDLRIMMRLNDSANVGTLFEVGALFDYKRCEDLMPAQRKFEPVSDELLKHVKTLVKYIK